MSDLGQLLKKARLDRGITLESLQDTTKIRKRYLEAIEDGEYKVLPGSFYVRAFIKSYAEAVGLDPEEVLRLYQHAIPANEPEPVITEPVRRKRRNATNLDRISKWASSFLMVAFLVLILILIYTFALNRDEGGNSQVSNDPPITDELDAGGSSPTPVATPTPTPTPTPEPTPVVSLVSTESDTLVYNVTNADQLKVDMEFSADCWSLFRKDNSTGEEIKTFTYGNGDKDTLAADHSLHLRFGFVKGVKLIVNGVELTDPGLERSGSLNVQLNLVGNEANNG